ncbi:MAG: CidA/LrgA family protein, partial [Fibrobacter sp.]|nr:CidA/LrgA family protein [Fibrobacter sp.]
FCGGRFRIMKYINQFLIILLISFLGEILKCLLPLPIPASIYGMIILFLGLMTKVIKLESVKETGKFLIEIMPIMFIPAGVGLMTTWGVLQPILLPVSIITAVTIITVMVATGWVSQIIIRKSGKKKDE